MTVSYAGKVPSVVERYFGGDCHPIITAEFRDVPVEKGKLSVVRQNGWVSTSYKKRITKSWARKLKSEGVTHVELSSNDINADFTIAEILSPTGRKARR